MEPGGQHGSLGRFGAVTTFDRGGCKNQTLPFLGHGFPEGTSLVQALQEGWRSYRNPLDPDEVFGMPERQVVRWRWSGRVRLAMGVEWALGAGWALPGTVPLVDIRKDLSSLAALGAHVEAVEEGEFSIQLRKRAGTIEFRLRRHRERRRQASLSAGLHLGSQIRVVRLGPPSRGPLRILSQGLQEPLQKKRTGC